MGASLCTWFIGVTREIHQMQPPIQIWVGAAYTVGVMFVMFYRPRLHATVTNADGPVERYGNYLGCLWSGRMVRWMLCLCHQLNGNGQKRRDR